MVLCAGYGTRLRPLTDECPKPLVPIGDRPILAHIAVVLRRAGFTSAVINTHHLAEVFAKHVERISLDLSLIHEPQIRGTAGGVTGARSLLGPAPVLVWNGDTLADPPCGELMRRVGDGLCLAVAPRAAGRGSVGVDEAGTVVRLRGEQFGKEVAGGDYIGVAALGSRCLAGLPERGCLIGDWALPTLRAGGPVRAVRSGSPWFDAGHPQGYLEANLSWLSHTVGPGQSWVAPSAALGNSVQLEQSVVGPDAHVGGRGLVRCCVVWPGARAAAPLSHSIVTSQGRLVRCG
jgi:mannose-1-phosphate guanylyltransferase